MIEPTRSTSVDDPTAKIISEEDNGAEETKMPTSLGASPGKSALDFTDIEHGEDLESIRARLVTNTNWEPTITPFDKLPQRGFFFGLLPTVLISIGLGIELGFAIGLSLGVNLK